MFLMERDIGFFKIALEVVAEEPETSESGSQGTGDILQRIYYELIQIVQKEYSAGNEDEIENCHCVQDGTTESCKICVS